MSPRPRKKKPEEITDRPPTPLELTPEDWQEVEHGIGLFNSGKFWHAHEAWELVWQRHSADERLFFQGLIQLAAAYHHLVTNRSRTGYVNNLRKAAGILQVFAPEYVGVRVTPLLGAIEAGLATAGVPTGTEAGTRDERRASPEELKIIPKISFHLPFHPDLVVAIRAATSSSGFAEGVALFNEGYHWEAHERWEDVQRAAEGEAKKFVQGFVQAAAGVTFHRARKTERASYLFLKSVETLTQFEEINCGVNFRSLLNWMAGLVGQNGSGGAGPTHNGTTTPAIILLVNEESSPRG